MIETDDMMTAATFIVGKRINRSIIVWKKIETIIINLKLIFEK